MEQPRLAPDEFWEDDHGIVELNGELVRIVERGLHPDPDSVRPGEGLQEVLITWPDGSAFRMELYLSPRWWNDGHEGAAVAFWGSVYDLIRSGLNKDEPMSNHPVTLVLSEEGHSVFYNKAGEEVRNAWPEAVLRFIADLMENGTLKG